MEQNTESLILRNLIYNDEYSRKVLPHLKTDYFKSNSAPHEKLLFDYIHSFIMEYNTLPSIEALSLKAENANLVEGTYDSLKSLLGRIEEGKDTKSNQQWLIDQTEVFCKEKAFTNAAYKAVSILEGTDKKLEKGAIPKIFEDALAVSFDTTVGHDYFENAEERYDALHSPKRKIPFDVEKCNEATKGGVEPKTLNIIAGGVYAGKTLAMCHMAVGAIKSGKNVLYISLEIDEHKINHRIDCNLLNMSVDDADNFPKKMFMAKVEKARKEVPGKLITKDYPASSVSVINFKALLHELKLKKEFVPDIIFVDYLNLMISSTMASTDKTHISIDAICKELRGLAQEMNVPIWSATQMDAEGMNSSSPGMTNISGSKVQLAAHADLLWSIVCTDALRELGQIMIIQQKNRYRDAGEMKKFYIGIDRKKFRWHDCEQRANPVSKDEEDPLDQPPSDNYKQEASKKYGTEAYKPAYNSPQSKKFGPRNKEKVNFSDFKV